jgi:hypothetical protein
MEEFPYVLIRPVDDGIDDGLVRAVAQLQRIREEIMCELNTGVLEKSHERY